ncbi:MAG TPA: oxygenase MpaB family protein [Acidobacteriaceae bacterium]|nr:oxygenase MpaB family protein [Acidobacteriaceae bacterium]
MNIPTQRQTPSLVSKADVEALLQRIQKRTGNPLEGIFGPRSVSWKINREAAVFLGAGRAALLQLAHPWVAAALDQHSTTLANPIGRFHSTFRVIYTMVFGTERQVIAAAHHMHSLHTQIRGELPEAAAGFTAGSHYEANERNALRWVYATLVESAILAYDFALPPLTPAERASYYSESKWMAALFGIAPEELPENWSAFEHYNREMWASDTLGATPKSRFMAHRILHGSGSWVRPPEWYRSLTALWMPRRLREEFHLRFGPAEQYAVAQARRRIPVAYAALPLRLRHVGPYHEAQARLAGKPRPPWVARASNRFWMGQSRLMFSESVDERREAS